MFIISPRKSALLPSLFVIHYMICPLLESPHIAGCEFQYRVSYDPKQPLQKIILSGEHFVRVHFALDVTGHRDYNTEKP